MLTHYRKYWDIAGYTYWADIYCADCGADLPEVDSEGNDRQPVLAGELSGFDPESNEGHTYHCAKCGLATTEW